MNLLTKALIQKFILGMGLKRGQWLFINILQRKQWEEPPSKEGGSCPHKGRAEKRHYKFGMSFLPHGWWQCLGRSLTFWCLVQVNTLHQYRILKLRVTVTLTGTHRGLPPLQKSQGVMTHRRHHKITNWKSLLQPHCKGLRLDLPNLPCDTSMATCQRARGRQGHLPFLETQISLLYYSCKQKKHEGFQEATPRDDLAVGEQVPRQSIWCIGLFFGSVAFLRGEVVFLQCLKLLSSPSGPVSSSGDN